jgi:hypothetical protein
MTTSIIISGPLGLHTHRDDITGKQVLGVDGIGISASGVVYYRNPSAIAAERADLAYDPASGWVSAIKEN